MLFVTEHAKLNHVRLIEKDIDVHELTGVGYVIKSSDKPIKRLVELLIDGFNHIERTTIPPPDEQELKLKVLRLLDQSEQDLLKYVAVGLTMDDIAERVNYDVDGLLTKIRNKLKKNFELELRDPILGLSKTSTNALWLSHLAHYLGISDVRFSVFEKTQSKNKNQ